MVDSRAKGVRGEYAVRDLLRDYTGIAWERVPTSGATEHTKGDIYVPQEKQKYIIEVKNYKDSPISPTLLSAKTNDLKSWWRKLSAQAFGLKAVPILFFKHDRSRWFIAVESKPEKVKDYLFISSLNCYVMLAEDFLAQEWKTFNAEPAPKPPADKK